MEHPVMLERSEELAALSAAAAAAASGHGALVLVEGPAGIGKTTLLRAACRADLRILTARGLALEQGFPYGVVRQLLDPVRRQDGLMDGAAAGGWAHGVPTGAGGAGGMTRPRMRRRSAGDVRPRGSRPASTGRA